ncbi:hypothetical protein ACFONN_17415 [Dyella humi]|uniref:Uncharacterized protein n=1 Tax=Dyella humi TaxID=1770547 RepID=A0ABW8IFQ5_9GAMM
MNSTQSSDDLIAMSVVEATIHAPVESIDLTEWVFSLTDAEYQTCSKAHIAGGATFRIDGKRMSINVENVGNLLIQHYVEDIAERAHCRLVSMSDSIGPAIDERTKVIVVWDLSVQALDAKTTRFTNHIEVRITPDYLEMLEKRGITLEQARVVARKALNAHNAEEAPLYANNIERKAIAERWS